MITIESYNPRVGRKQVTERRADQAGRGLFTLSGNKTAAVKVPKPGSYILRELFEFQVDQNDMPSRGVVVPRLI